MILELRLEDKLMFDVFRTTLRLELYKILENIGVFVPHTMMSNFEYIITLPASSDVLITQMGEVSTDYSLEIFIKNMILL